MTYEHMHKFFWFIGLETAWDRMAWVREDFVDGNTFNKPRMLRCDICGEQGYEIPADA